MSLVNIMNRYRVQTIARFAAVLGEAFENARMAKGVPDLATKQFNWTVKAVADQFARQISEQSDGKVTFNYSHEHYDVNDIVGDDLAEFVRSQIKTTIESIRDSAGDLRLSSRWDLKIQRLIEALHDADVVSIRERLRLLIDDLSDELSEPLFLQIETSRRGYYEQNEPPFGARVADKFGQSSRDIAASARCFALDEWTACVSHLMRALEYPLQVFANRLGVAFPSPTDLENWKNIIDQMQSKIDAEVRRLEGTPKSSVSQLR